MLKIVTFLLFLALPPAFSQSYTCSDIFFLDDHNGWILGTNGYLWKTTDSGSNWLKIEEPRFNTLGKIQFTDEETGWIMVGGTLYSSKDGGLNWEHVFEPTSTSYSAFNILNSYTNNLHFCNNDTGFITSDSNLYITLNSGKNWELLVDTLGSIDLIYSNGSDNIFLGSLYWYGDYLFKSTNLGESWDSVYFTDIRFNVMKMFNSNTGVLGYTYAGYVGISRLLYTVDGGDSWEHLGWQSIDFGMNDLEFFSLNEGWITTQTSKIIKITDLGTNWDTLQTSATMDEIYDFEFFDSNLSYGINQEHLYFTSDGWITYSIVDSILTNVEDRNIIPGSFILSQNYPNPFNPVTKINYYIPEGSNVKLKIINLLGEEIAVLVDQIQSAGEYNIEFSPDYNLTSGVYLYQLEAGEFRETKKMIYLK